MTASMESKRMAALSTVLDQLSQAECCTLVRAMPLLAECRATCCWRSRWTISEHEAKYENSSHPRPHSVRRLESLGRAEALLEPARIPAEYISGQAADEDLVRGRDMDPVAGAFHGSQDLAGCQIDPHDAAGESVVGDVFDVIAVGDDPHLI